MLLQVCDFGGRGGDAPLRAFGVCGQFVCYAMFYAGARWVTGQKLLLARVWGYKNLTLSGTHSSNTKAFKLYNQP